MIEGLTTGVARYNGIFILRNPENSSLMQYALEEIPIYAIKRLRNIYDVCTDFRELKKRENIKDLVEASPNKVGDLYITPFLVDPSNFNTQIIKIEDNSGKTIVVCGDFRNYDGIYGRDRLTAAISTINSADALLIEGKYLGKSGIEYSSGKEIIEKLKNIMKFYKQVFVLQSETDLIMASTLYQGALKTKKIFIEDTFLSNITTAANGSCPSPFKGKKTYSYNPILVETKEFEFKKKYVAPFYISSAKNKMKKEKYVMNITKEMLQDLQLLKKEGAFYDACVIVAEWKGFIEIDPELEEFIDFLKKCNMDYYELYTHGQVDMITLKELVRKWNPHYVIPIEFSNERNIESELSNFKVLREEEVLEI